MCPLPLAAAAVTAPRSPLRLLGRGLAAAMSTGRPLKSVDYEVFGRVQGVCFRMYTEDEARKIGVVGWVKNTSKGTVTGQVQGPEEKVNSIGEKIQSWKVSCSRSHSKFRVLNRHDRRKSQDGRGVRQGEHFLPHKFIKRAFKSRVNSTKQLLKASRGHQAPRKATQVFERRK
ncbi:acylphosphatase-2 isoform X3 [Bos mutus]